jgi:hypothetical protein
MSPDRVRPSDLRPSQLYVSAEKLSAMLDRTDGPDHEFGPLPVYEFDGERYLTDGHTRVFTAYLMDADEVVVEYDAELPENYDVALYQKCIEWCNEAGVERVPDLVGRVLPPEAYEREWIERCHWAAERLEGD